MCMSKPKAPPPTPLPPQVAPESVDETVIEERDRERRRNRLRAGRQSTILAGDAGVPPTQPVKTALGS
jgi:hypothetical protein